MDRTKIFLSYAPEDESWKDLLVLHLAVLERQGLVHVWADTRIQIGADWQMQIQKGSRRLTGRRVADFAKFLAFRIHS
jgi:hypothetical protein